MRRDADTAARTGGANLLGILVHAGAPVFHIAVTNLFGAAVYGLYAYALGVLEIFTRLAMCGTEIGLLRYVALHRGAGAADDEGRALGTALRTTFGFGVVLAVLVALLAQPLADLYDKPAVAGMLRRLSPAIPFAACTVVLVAATLAVKVARINLLVRGIGEPVLLLSLAGATAAIAPTALGLALAHLAAVLLIFAAAVWGFARVFGQGRLFAALRARRHGDLLRFSVPLSGAEILTVVLQRADLLILLYFVGEAALGIYAAAEFVARAVGNARYAFDYVACPVLAEAHRDGDRARVAYNLGLMTRWVVLLALPLATFFVGFRAEVLGLFGDDFREAALAFVILVAGHLVNAALGLTGWVVAMAGRSRLMLLNALAGAAVNLALNLVLIPSHGILGAAWAALISVTFFRGLELLEAIGLEGVQPLTPGLVKGLFAAGAALGVTLGFRELWGAVSVPALVTLGILHLVLYLALTIALGLAPEERRIVARIPGLRWLEHEPAA